MQCTRSTRVLFATLTFTALACRQPDADHGSSETTGTGSSVASCVDECRDFYDCHYSLCLLEGGSSCGTQRIDGLESCDRLVEGDCTPSLLATYDSCGAADDSDSSTPASSSTSDGDGSSSGWGESSSDGDGSSSGWWGSSSESGTSCLPGNSFCDYDSECCSGVCDDDFAFCH